LHNTIQDRALPSTKYQFNNGLFNVTSATVSLTGKTVSKLVIPNSSDITAPPVVSGTLSYTITDFNIGAWSTTSKFTGGSLTFDPTANESLVSPSATVASAFALNQSLTGATTIKSAVKGDVLASFNETIIASSLTENSSYGLSWLDTKFSVVNGAALKVSAAEGSAYLYAQDSYAGAITVSSKSAGGAFALLRNVGLLSDVVISNSSSPGVIDFAVTAAALTLSAASAQSSTQVLDGLGNTTVGLLSERLLAEINDIFTAEGNSNPYTDISGSADNIARYFYDDSGTDEADIDLGAVAFINDAPLGAITVTAAKGLGALVIANAIVASDLSADNQTDAQITAAKPAAVSVTGQSAVLHAESVQMGATTVKASTADATIYLNEAAIAASFTIGDYGLSSRDIEFSIFNGGALTASSTTGSAYLDAQDSYAGAVSVTGGTAGGAFAKLRYTPLLANVVFTPLTDESGYKIAVTSAKLTLTAKGSQSSSQVLDGLGSTTDGTLSERLLAGIIDIFVAEGKSDPYTDISGSAEKIARYFYDDSGTDEADIDLGAIALINDAPLGAITITAGEGLAALVIANTAVVGTLSASYSGYDSAMITSATAATVTVTGQSAVLHAESLQMGATTVIAKNADATMYLNEGVIATTFSVADYGLSTGDINFSKLNGGALGVSAAVGSAYLNAQNSYAGAVTVTGGTAGGAFALLRNVPLLAGIAYLPNSAGTSYNITATTAALTLSAKGSQSTLEALDGIGNSNETVLSTRLSDAITGIFSTDDIDNSYALNTSADKIARYFYTDTVEGEAGIDLGAVALINDSPTGAISVSATQGLGALVIANSALVTKLTASKMINEDTQFKTATPAMVNVAGQSAVLHAENVQMGVTTVKATSSDATMYLDESAIASTFSLADYGLNSGDINFSKFNGGALGVSAAVGSAYLNAQNSYAGAVTVTGGTAGGAFALLRNVPLLAGTEYLPNSAGTAYNITATTAALKLSAKGSQSTLEALDGIGNSNDTVLSTRLSDAITGIFSTDDIDNEYTLNTSADKIARYFYDDTDGSSIELGAVALINDSPMAAISITATQGLGALVIAGGGVISSLKASESIDTGDNSVTAVTPAAVTVKGQSAVLHAESSLMGATTITATSANAKAYLYDATVGSALTIASYGLDSAISNLSALTGATLKVVATTGSAYLNAQNSYAGAVTVSGGTAGGAFALMRNVPLLASITYLPNKTGTAYIITASTAALTLTATGSQSTLEALDGIGNSTETVLSTRLSDAITGIFSTDDIDDSYALNASADKVARYFYDDTDGTSIELGAVALINDSPMGAISISANQGLGALVIANGGVISSLKGSKPIDTGDTSITAVTPAAVTVKGQSAVLHAESCGMGATTITATSANAKAYLYDATVGSALTIASYGLDSAISNLSALTGAALKVVATTGSAYLNAQNSYAGAVTVTGGTAGGAFALMRNVPLLASITYLPNKAGTAYTITANTAALTLSAKGSQSTLEALDGIGNSTDTVLSTRLSTAITNIFSTDGVDDSYALSTSAEEIAHYFYTDTEDGEAGIDLGAVALINESPMAAITITATQGLSALVIANGGVISSLKGSESIDTGDTSITAVTPATVTVKGQSAVLHAENTQMGAVTLSGTNKVDLTLLDSIVAKKMVFSTDGSISSFEGASISVTQSAVNAGLTNAILLNDAYFSKLDLSNVAGKSAISVVFDGSDNAPVNSSTVIPEIALKATNGVEDVINLYELEAYSGKYKITGFDLTLDKLYYDDVQISASGQYDTVSVSIVGTTVLIDFSYAA
jgi:hypothetical protein